MIRLKVEGIEEFSIKLQEDLDDLVRMSVQDLGHVANTPVSNGGRLPVRTGFLRNSLVPHFSGESRPPLLKNQGSESQRFANAQAIAGNVESAQLKLANVEAGDVIFLTWAAAYAAAVEFGLGGSPARLFATSAAEQWSTIVKENARNLVA